MAILFGVLNALLISVSNVAGGVAARRAPLSVVMVSAALTSIAVAVVIAVAYPGEPSTTGVAIGFVAGLCGGIGLPIAYRAFSIGPVGVVGAVLALTATSFLAAFGFATGSPVTPARIAGLALCVVAITLVSYRRPAVSPSGRASGPLLAAAAAVFFSAFVVLIDAAPAADGFWPVVAARIGVGTIAGGLLIWGVGRQRSASRRPRWPASAVGFAVLAGATDVVGNLFLVLALAAGDLVLLAVLTPVAPVFTALIGWWFLKERLTQQQIAGLGVASAALMLASF